MDLRRYFKKPRLELDLQQSSSNSDKNEQEISSSIIQKKSEKKDFVTIFEFDIGNFINHGKLPDDILYKALKEPWTPTNWYDFKKDSSSGNRIFRIQWLNDYSFISYSAKLKGVLCHYCVLFKPHLDRGVQGRFIVKEFSKYKDFHDSVKRHVKSKWHCEALNKANDFCKIVENKNKSVVQLMNSALQQKIESNRAKIMPIVKTIVFCATKNIPLRGSTDNSAIINSLLKFRIDAGDSILNDHLQNSPANSTYISHRVQNEILDICNEVLREHIIIDVKNSQFFSIIADESSDISGIEQLSLGVRFVHKMPTGDFCVREEFLGFVPLQLLNAESIAETILTTLAKFGLDLSLVVGQAYDGCSTMAGKISGVRKRIQDKYPLANFFHCSSHKLNLVINDISDVSEIRNTVGTIKDVINFFRESPLRRKYIPNIPMFCETRWTSKYKSIRIFKENINTILEALQKLSKGDVNRNTKQRAFQLHNSCSNSTLLVCLFVMAEYSSMLEPIANILQGVNQNLITVRNQINTLTQLFKQHRNSADTIFSVLWEKMQSCLTQSGIEITIPRIAKNQTHRSNVSVHCSQDYFKINIFIRYLDSLIISLQDRFSEENKVPYSLFQLLPEHMLMLNEIQYQSLTKTIAEKYGSCLDNFSTESMIWYSYYKQKTVDKKPKDILDVLNEAELFYPSVFKALCIGLTIPASTCTAERSFSTLRKVKTWLRSTMTDKRLDALCMMNIHKDLMKNLINDNFYGEIIDRFGRDSRRLQFVFQQE